MPINFHEISILKTKPFFSPFSNTTLLGKSNIWKRVRMTIAMGKKFLKSIQLMFKVYGINGIPKLKFSIFLVLNELAKQNHKNIKTIQYFLNF